MSNYQEVFPKIQQHVILDLLSCLSGKLTYHNIDHTQDVLDQAQRIAAEEGILNEEELFLLKIAALYHDTGFLSAYVGHEEVGCGYARRDLPQFGLSPAQIERVCSLILATKLPQRPQNHLEEVICDADLDYLGQDDFEPISDGLRREFLEYGIVHSNKEWFSRQMNFLETHQYFTESSKKNRSPVKLQYMEKLRSA